MAHAGPPPDYPSLAFGKAKTGLVSRVHRPSSSIWLDLKSGAPGLPGPYLQEFNAAYKHLDTLGTPPRLIFAIGGRLKRKYLASTFQQSCDEIEREKICLRLLSRSKGLVAIDCELHLKRDLPKILGGPCPGHYTNHYLASASGLSSPSVIASRLYGEILAPFCQATVLFVADFFGVENTVCLLVSWIRSAMLRPRSSSETRMRVLLVLDRKCHTPVTSANHIWFQITTTLLRQLRLDEPTNLHTFVELQKRVFDYMHLDILPDLSDHEFAETLYAKLEPAVRFSAAHLRFLLKAAIRHFASDPPNTFNSVLASRKLISLPPTWQGHMFEFIRRTKHTSLQHASLVASALTLNAYPPGMFHFAPHDVFTYSFEKPMIELQKALKQTDFNRKVKHEFIDKVRLGLSTGDSFAKAHLATLGATSSVWASITSSTTCYFCLSRAPSHTLDCRHRICSCCIIICGESIDHWKYQVSQCPFCHHPNQATFLLRPPTAGTRTLHLGGSNPDNTLRFLSDLQREVGLATMPIREYFDVVDANGLGIFFVLTLFLHKWTRSDCKYHLNRLQGPKYKRNGIVRFGHNLDWDLNEVVYFNGAKVVISAKGKVYSNFHPVPGREGLDSIDAHSLDYSDLHVRYDGGNYSEALLKSTSNRLTATLFYIELEQIPEFYTSPQTCYATIHCRVPPGHALLDLLHRLHHFHTRVAYRGDELDYVDVPFIELAALKECRNGKPFRKTIAFKANSMATMLDVNLRGTDRSQYHISHCPYELQQLVRDQGLDCVFGRLDHRTIKPARSRGGKRCGTELDQAFLELENVLRNFHEEDWDKFTRERMFS